MITYITEEYSSTTNLNTKMEIIECSIMRKELWDEGISWEETLNISKRKLFKLYIKLGYFPYIQNKINMWFSKLNSDYERITSKADYNNWEYRINESRNLGIYDGIDCRTLDILTLVKLRRSPSIWNIMFGY